MNLSWWWCLLFSSNPIGSSRWFTPRNAGRRQDRFTHITDIPLAWRRQRKRRMYERRFDSTLSRHVCEAGGCGRCSWTLLARSSSGNWFSNTRTLPPLYLNNKMCWFIFFFLFLPKYTSEFGIAHARITVWDITNSVFLFRSPNPIWAIINRFLWNVALFLVSLGVMKSAVLP
jgi:hypothetical protein